MFTLSKPVVASTKPTVILPLGLLFVPNDQLAIQKLMTFVGKENQDKISAFLKVASPFIDRLKKGEDEEKFDNEMVSLVESELNTKITKEQFNECWRARYNDKSIKKGLNLITSESKEYAYDFYSGTNRKDAEEIIKLCEKNGIKFKVENGRLTEIQGVKIRDTFTEKVSKVELFIIIAKEKYKRGEREINLIIASEDGQAIPVLKEELTKSNKLLMTTAESMNIHAIKADPKKEELDITSVLQQEKQTITCKL